MAAVQPEPWLRALITTTTTTNNNNSSLNESCSRVCGPHHETDWLMFVQLHQINGRYFCVRCCLVHSTVCEEVQQKSANFAELLSYAFIPN
jgi:hypothetical protein